MTHNSTLVASARAEGEPTVCARDAAASLLSLTHVSRRAAVNMFVASVSAVAVATPADLNAKNNDDPAFRAIERHREAKALRQACEETAPDEEFARLVDTEYQALRDLALTIPETVVGARRQLSYWWENYRSNPECDNEPMRETLRMVTSIWAAVGRIDGSDLCSAAKLPRRTT